jgi:hypothetical protein
MSTKVIVKQFGGKDIGVIAYDAQGTLVILAQQPELQAELEALIHQIAQQPLTAVSGEYELKNGMGVHKTIARPVTMGEPRYLLALADVITQSESIVGGKRVRAYVLTD